MSDLVEWLVVQLAEDERIARAAGSAAWRWEQDHGDMCNDATCPYGQLVADNSEGETVLMRVHGYDVHEQWQGAEHIAAHDPARVLRDIDAMRRQVARHAPHEMGSCLTCEAPHFGVKVCNHCERRWPCPDVRDLADVYADRPGYREQWRP